MKYKNFMDGDVIGVLDCNACEEMLSQDAELKRVQTKEELEEIKIMLKEIEELCYACRLEK